MDVDHFVTLVENMENDPLWGLAQFCVICTCLFITSMYLTLYTVVVTDLYKNVLWEETNCDITDSNGQAVAIMGAGVWVFWILTGCCYIVTAFSFGYAIWMINRMRMPEIWRMLLTANMVLLPVIMLHYLLPENTMQSVFRICWGINDAADI